MLRAKGITILAVVDHSGEAAKVGLTPIASAIAAKFGFFSPEPGA